jgi:hypothetical protein
MVGTTGRNTIAFGAAMTYDRIVRAIGPFEALEYVGLAGIYAALGLTAPFVAPRPSRSRPTHMAERERTI